LVKANLEAQLARIFGLSLTGAVLFLAVGIVLPAALWFGVAALVAAPLIGAVLTWRDSSVSNAVRWSMAVATLGLLVAVAAGFWLRR
jgi:hypothetical protein